MIGNGSVNINLKLFNVQNVWRNAETKLIPEDWPTIGIGGTDLIIAQNLLHKNDLLFWEKEVQCGLVHAPPTPKKSVKIILNLRFHLWWLRL